MKWYVCDMNREQVQIFKNKKLAIERAKERTGKLTPTQNFGTLLVYTKETITIYVIEATSLEHYGFEDLKELI